MAKERTALGITAVVAVIAIIALVAGFLSYGALGEYRKAVNRNTQITYEQTQQIQGWVRRVPITIGWCTDTDGGINYYTAGMVYGENPSNGTFSYNDTCFGSDLQEWYCLNTGDNNTIRWEPRATGYNCEYGCSNGACNQPPPAWCFDSDGFNVWIQGYVNASNGFFVDICAVGNGTNTTLLEGICSNNQGTFQTVDCRNYGNRTRCDNGRCTNSTTA